MYAQVFKKFDPNEARDDHGRWTADGEAGQHVKPAYSAQELFDRISEPDSGFTYQPVTGVEPKKGFALSIYPKRSFAKPAKDLTLKDLATYAKKNRDLFTRKNHFLGAWHDPESGKVFFDVSVMTEDRKKAERLAKKYDQIAYFDLGAGKSVTVNRNATSGGAAKGEGDEPEATDAARAAWIEDYLGGGTREAVQEPHGPGADGGGDRGSAEGTGAEVGFSHVFKTGTSEGADKAWETRHAEGEGKSFEVGGISFTPIRRTHPVPHWAFRIDETGVVHDAGTGGVSGKSAPKMLADLKDLFERDSKGNVEEFRRQWGLGPAKKAEGLSAIFKYSPDQLRDPAGSPTGGQFASGGGAGGAAGPVSHDSVSAAIVHDIAQGGVSDQHEAGNLVERLVKDHKDELINLIDKLPENKRPTILLHKGDKDKGIPTVWLLGWSKGEGTDLHDHHGSKVGVSVVRGEVRERVYGLPHDFQRLSEKDKAGVPASVHERNLREGSTVTIPDPYIHEVFGTSAINKRDITLHAYYPPLNKMTYYKYSDGKLYYDGKWQEGHVQTPGEPIRKCACCSALEFLTKFDPEQPRAPAGDPAGGQWVSEAAKAGNPATKLMEGRSPLSETGVDKASEALLKEKLTEGEQKTYTARLAAIKDALARGQDSKSLNSKDGKYTPERAALHKDLIDSLITRAKTFALPGQGEKPTVVVLGGRGGSGKSSFGTYPKDGAALGIYNENKFLTLDTDNFKTLLAQHDKTAVTDSHGDISVGWRAPLYHEESADVFDKAVARARRAGVNVVLDITMNSAHGNRLAAFKKAGYNAEGYYMHLPPEQAAARAVSRARDNGTMNGRMVSPKYILSSTNNEKNFETLLPKFSKWAVYSNDVPRGTHPKLVASGTKTRKEESFFERIFKYGTSAGAYKAWETMHGAGGKHADKGGGKAKAMVPLDELEAAAKFLGVDKAFIQTVANAGGPAHNSSGFSYTNTQTGATVTSTGLKSPLNTTPFDQQVAATVGNPTPNDVLASVPVKDKTDYANVFANGNYHAKSTGEGFNKALYTSLDQHAEAQWKMLPQSVKTAVAEYTDDTSIINKQAAGVEGVFGHDETIRGLDSLLNNSEINENISVYRGMAMKNFAAAFGTMPADIPSTTKGREAYLKDRVGSVYTEKAFASTSLRPFFYGYANALSEQGKIGLKINIKKGSPGYFFGSRSFVQGEEEVLLPRGSKFVITKLVRDNNQGSTPYYYEVNLIPPKGGK